MERSSTSSRTASVPVVHASWQAVGTRWQPVVDSRKLLGECSPVGESGHLLVVRQRGVKRAQWVSAAQFRREYQEWNNHIIAFGPAQDELLAGPITAALPTEARTATVMEWIKSHLTRAYLECIYSPVSDVRLARIQVNWYITGHFPCGWSVDEETAFPNQAVTIVY